MGQARAVKQRVASRQQESRASAFGTVSGRLDISGIADTWISPRIPKLSKLRSWRGACGTRGHEVSRIHPRWSRSFGCRDESDADLRRGSGASGPCNRPHDSRCIVTSCVLPTERDRVPLTLLKLGSERRSPRFRFDAPLSAALGLRGVELIDISARGATIRHVLPVRPGDQLPLRFEYRGRMFDLECRILDSRFITLGGSG
jgi:PilZ domain